MMMSSLRSARISFVGLEIVKILSSVRSSLTELMAPPQEEEGDEDPEEIPRKARLVTRNLLRNSRLSAMGGSPL